MYDNVGDVSVRIANYLPKCRHGSVVITTRSQLLGRLASHNDFHVKLGPMSDEEAIESIYKSSELEESEETQPSMASIATELGNLPVALIQVGSYILRTTCTPNEYLKKLQKHKAELMKTSTGDREDRSAYAAFDISYQRLPHLIRHFLHILSHMHYCDFPLEVVIHAAQDNFRLRPFSFPGKSEDYERVIEFLSEIFNRNENISLVVDSIVTTLQNYSLATFYRTSVGRLLRIHPLNHLWSGILNLHPRKLSIELRRCVLL